jgi:hypothetical protein
MFYFSICFISFISLFILGVFLFLLGFYFVFNDLVVFIEWDVITLNFLLLLLIITYITYFEIFG